MKRTVAKSENAGKALRMLEQLQAHFVSKLEDISQKQQKKDRFQQFEWVRDQGMHGGGHRRVANEGGLFNRGSVNISQVHYDDDPKRPLGSATALSTIIHPDHPLAASVHMHISWTEMKDGNGYWRIMADLNPAIPKQDQTIQFQDALKQLAPEQYTQGSQQGDRYFYIPALHRHRGVTHFYLEQYHKDGFAKDLLFAEAFGRGVIDQYAVFLEQSLQGKETPSSSQRQEQLTYHTLYFLQVLTLDRGTTSGLLVHDQNDVGTLGSLPSHVNKDLLVTWVDQHPFPQNHLLEALINVLPEAPDASRQRLLGIKDPPYLIDEDCKRRLALCIRTHYQQYPESLNLQASGGTIPPTVANHQS